MYACAFISKFSDGISKYLIGQNVPILNYFDHRATIHQLPFTHFFHYLPTSWCSLNSSWPSLWLWRTRLAASLILCRSSSSSSSGSIIINVHNKQKIGSKCRRSKQSSVQNILIPKMKPEWNTDIFEILNMYFSLKDSLSVIITNPNKNHLLALFAQIMVALYNENLFPTDIIIFFLKSNQNVYIVGLGLTFFLLAILPARHDWHTSLYQASLFFYTVAAIIKKMEWCHYTHNQPAYSNLQTRPIKKEAKLCRCQTQGCEIFSLGQGLDFIST